MRAMLLAGLLALSSCHAEPAFAQDAKCTELAPLLVEAGAARSSGAKVVVFTGDMAATGLEALGALMGPPPRPVEITTLLLVSFQDKAFVILGEGNRACFKVHTTAKNARVIELAITGEPV